MLDNKARKILVSLAVEHTLLKIDQKYLEKLEKKLYQEYHCSIADCYDHPEYLNEALEEIFRDSHRQVKQSIEKYLHEFTYEYSIKQFIQKINFG